MNVAIIPARGGSKRIPRKNIRPFCGKPMLQWTVEAAKSSGCFDRIVVSTDDDEIAGLATQLGVEVPFRRPPELSDDHATTGAVMRHAVGLLLGSEPGDSWVCCLYATAPFLDPADIRAGRDALRGSGGCYAFPVTTFAYPIQRALRISAQGRVEMVQPGMFEARSQDLEECFHDAGQFYWGTARAWLEGRPIFLSDAIPVRIPRSRVQDIDTPEDWERAERLFEAIRSDAS